MKIKTQRSDGVYIYTREGLTAEQLRAKVQSDIMSNPSYSNQLKINAKWKYNDNEAFNQMLSPLVKNYDSQIDALEQEIQRKAAAIPNAGGVGKEQQLQVLNYEKANLENQKKEFEAIRNQLKDPMIDLSRKKEIFEMMQLQERAVNSFPQSETRTPDKFALLAQQGLQKERQMGLKFNYDVALDTEKTKNEIAKEQQLEALGLNKSSSSSKTTAETGINPIGEAMPTTAISNDNREGIINNQISNYKEQNAADFVGLMSQMISEKMNVDNPDVLKNAMTTAFLANRKAGYEKLGGEFFNKYIKNTPSYQKLEKKMQDGLIAQYNHLNSAYKDVLDGKQDTDFSSWEFSNETQEALTKIQLRSYNMKVKEDMINKAKKAAEDKMIQEVYKGDRRKYEADRDAKEVITSIPNTGMKAGNQASKVSSKAEFNSKIQNYLEGELIQQNISLEKPYLLSEDSMKKENYAAVKNIVGDAISNGGIYETLNRTDDPIGLYGKIEGKDSKNDKFKNAKDFNVVKVWGDTGIAEVEVVTKEGDKETKSRGYVKLKQEGINEMYNYGLNRKSGDTDFNEIVESVGTSPIMMSGTNPPLFYRVVRNTQNNGFDVKLSLTSSANKTVHIKTRSSNPSAAREKVLSIINGVMGGSSSLTAMTPSEQKRQLVFDLIVEKYNSDIAK